MHLHEREMYSYHDTRFNAGMIEIRPNPMSMAKIHKLRFELLDHPPYSPDLAPSDFCLFPHPKIVLGRRIFSSNEEAITFVNNCFIEKNAEYYLDRLQRWEHRWEKYIELQGDYIEKNL